MNKASLFALLLGLTAVTAAAQSSAPVAQSPAAAAAAKRIRIVALGDSTTASYRDWAPVVHEVYADCLPGELEPLGIFAAVINAGIGDTTTEQAVARLDRDVRRFRPDLVVVQFGINDSWIDVDLGKTLPRLSRAQFRDNLRTIIRRLKHDKARIVLMTPNPMRWGDPFYIKAFTERPGLLDVTAVRGIDKLLDVYAQDVRDVARSEAVPLVDIFAAFESYGSVPGQSINDLLLTGDRIHPNQAGQRFVCGLLATRIAQVMARKSGP
jgi:lysophospholipase L1-like esterase